MMSSGAFGASSLERLCAALTCAGASAEAAIPNKLLSAERGDGTNRICWRTDADGSPAWSVPTAESLLPARCTTGGTPRAERQAAS